MAYIERLSKTLIKKREACYNASGFTSLNKSNHTCAILKDGMPISYGVNVYNINGMSTEHAEEQALRKLIEKNGKKKSLKKPTIDFLIIRTNGGNSKPCNRCINNMIKYTDRFNIRYIYYSDPDEIDGFRCVKFSKLITEERHICSYDRNFRRNKYRNN